MGQSAYVKLVEGSAASAITLDEVKEHLLAYQDITGRTGQQLDWDYTEAAFPYTFESKPDAKHWFYLQGTTERYRHLIFGIGNETGDPDASATHIQIVLPDESTHGDKSKANELCRFLAKRLQAKLQLFNGRTMYFNPRK